MADVMKRRNKWGKRNPLLLRIERAAENGDILSSPTDDDFMRIYLQKINYAKNLQKISLLTQLLNKMEFFWSRIKFL